VTAHRRAVLLRAGVVAAIVAGVLTGLATPAYAADPTVTVTSLSSGSLHPGESAELKFDVQISGPGAPLDIEVRSNLYPDIALKRNGASCGGACRFTETFSNDETKHYTITVYAPANANIQQGQQKSGELRITAGGSGPVTKAITLVGPEQAPVVPEVSGTVVDSTTNQVVKDAVVGLQDGASHTFTAGTDSNGRFKFTSSGDRPITPGTLTIGASKEGFDPIPRSFEGKAGQSITNVKVQLKPALASASAAATGIDPSAATDLPSGGDTANNVATSNAGSQTSTFSWILIGLGAVLVLLGIGAIVLLLVRRKDDGDDPDEEDGPPQRRGPVPPPGARGAYRRGADPTMVARSGGLADPTMVTRPGGPVDPTMAGRGADATAMIRPTRAGAEYPDPQRPGTRGAAYPTSPSPTAYTPQVPPARNAGGMYGPGGPAPATYGGPGYAGARDPEAYSPPVDPAGYGSRQAGGYGADSRGYDEPTGRHSDTYPGGGRGGGGGGYGGGYAPPPAGYDTRPAYEGGDYDRGGYQRPPEPPPARGYDPGEYGANGYYDEAAPSHRAAPPPGQGGRRSLDWLDD
jgi:hypothetical protein